MINNLCKIFHIPKNESEISSNMPFPYRQNVQMWVFNSKGKLSVINENDEMGMYWKFPQGGIEKGETVEEAAKRELMEEVNITNYRIMTKSKHIHHYEWPEELQRQKGYRGQEQTFYLIHATKPEQVKINEEEINRYYWLPFSAIIQKFTIPNQIEISKKAWEEFKPIVEKEMGKIV